MRLLFNNLIKITKELSMLIFLIIMILFISTIAEGNDLDLTIDNLTDGGSLDIVQDGENNDIDLDIVSMDGFIIDIDQVGDSNVLNVDVDGRTSNGSSMYFNQTGNNKSYSNTLWCGHSFCTITVNQN
jgi:hypothetical protein|tara:strand:- start:202 stop:585 length:384 start_codon:yes stop_codon:yes gene_type:complete